MRKLIAKVNQQILNGTKTVETPFLKQWLVYLPIIILIFYIGVSYVSYLICPLEWPLRYDLRTGIYMLLVVIALLGGYLFGARKKSLKVTFIDINVNKFYNKLLIAGVLLFVPSSYYKTGSVFPTIISSLINPGAQYFQTIKAINNRPGYYNVLGCFYIVTFAIIILTYYYWSELVMRQRLFGGTLAFLYMLIEMSSGKSIGVVILGVSILVCYFSKICRKNLKGGKATYTLFTVFVIGLMIFMFGYNLKSRTGYSVQNEVAYEQNLIAANELIVKEDSAGEKEESKREEDKREEDKRENTADELIETCLESERVWIKSTYDMYKLYENVYKANLGKSADEYLENYANKAYTVSDYYRMPDALVYVHIDNKIYQGIPDKLKFLYTMGTTYMSNGYHGLSLALYLPFDSCFGLGHLKAVQYYLDKLFGVSGDIPSYENKLIELGWPVGLRWETIFAQFASDFSFAGTILVMFAMGWLLNKLWVEMVAGGNFITVLLFSFYCVQFFFVSSWWYAGLTGGYFITFYLPLFCWIWGRCVIHKKINNKSIV